MFSQNIKQLIDFAKKHKGPIPEAVVKSIEVGVVVPSILKANLEAAGLIVDDEHDSHAKQGYCKLDKLVRVHVHGDAKLHPECPANHTDPNCLIAAGTAADKGDALLHACLGFLRECEIKAAKDKGEKPQEYGLGTVATKPLV